MFFLNHILSSLLQANLQVFRFILINFHIFPLIPVESLELWEFLEFVIQGGFFQSPSTVSFSGFLFFLPDRPEFDLKDLANVPSSVPSQAFGIRKQQNLDENTLCLEEQRVTPSKSRESVLRSSAITHWEFLCRPVLAEFTAGSAEEHEERGEATVRSARTHLFLLASPRWNFWRVVPNCVIIVPHLPLFAHVSLFLGERKTLKGELSKQRFLYFIYFPPSACK